jgi:hypothetical protein
MGLEFGMNIAEFVEIGIHTSPSGYRTLPGNTPTTA